MTFLLDLHETTSVVYWTGKTTGTYGECGIVANDRVHGADVCMVFHVESRIRSAFIPQPCPTAGGTMQSTLLSKNRPSPGLHKCPNHHRNTATWGNNYWKNHVR